jgi:hypothetical protein
MDDILIVYDQNKTNENSITNDMNNLHRYLEFKIMEQENNNINYLDLSIHRHNNNLNLGIYRKPTQTDTTIHFTSNYPLEQKLAAYTSCVNRMITLPITEQAKQQEWNTVLTTAENNGFSSLLIIHNLKTNLKHNKQKPHTHNKRKNGSHLLMSTYTQSNQFI